MSSRKKPSRPVDLSRYAVEDWVTLAVFWGMSVCVFLQFFTRYVLNNSLAWTEEIAINCLVVVVFLGSVMCTRMTRHIHVDVLYHYLPATAGRYLALAVNLITIGFFAYMSWLLWRYVGDRPPRAHGDHRPAAQRSSSTRFSPASC